MGINRLIYVLIIGFLSLSIYDASAQTLISGLSDKPISLDSTVRHGTLENGFTYYLKRSQSPSKEVYMKLAVKAGSFFETQSQAGYAHLLEHVALFNGNPHNLHSTVERAGMIPRAQTGNIFTKYQLIIPEVNRQKIELGLNTLKAWAGELKFDPPQVKVQSGAVLGEMRNRDPYQDWLSKSLGRILLQNVEFPMSSEERILKNIEHFNMSPLKEFYVNWYRPDMQAAIIVGDIDLDSIEKLVKKTFSGLKKKGNTKNSEDILKRFPIQLEGSNQYVQMKDSINTGRRLIMFKKEKNYDYNKFAERDYYNMFLQKIVNDIVQKRSGKIRKQYYPPFSNYSTNHTTSKFFMNQVLVSAMQVYLNGNPREIDNKVISALSAFKEMYSEITKQEVEEATKVLEPEFVQRFENNFVLAESYLQNFIKGTAVPSHTWQLKLHNLLTNIKVSEVQSFADREANLLKDKDFVFINMPQKYFPRSNGMIKIIHMVSKKPVSFSPPVRKMVIPDSILHSGYVYNNINKASKNIIGVIRLKLNNGIELWLKPTKPRSDEFNNQVEVLGFQPVRIRDPNKNVIPAILSHAYATYAGVAAFNKFQVAQYFEENNMELKFRTEDNEFLIKGKFQKKNLKEFFKILFLKIQEPDKDTAAFTSWRRKEKFLLSENTIRGGSTFFRSEIEKIWHPDYPFLTEKILDTINRDLLLQEYKKHFSDFKNYTFILTGDFNSETLLRQVEKYFEALPVSSKEEGLKPVSKEFIVKKRNDTIRLKNLDQAFAEIYYPVKVPVDIKTQVILGIINLALNERIFKRLRVGCYAPVADGYWIDKKNGIYAFRINFDSELGNEQNMLAYAEDEFIKLRKTGVDQAWLDAKIKMQTERFQQAISSFGYLNFWPAYLKKTIENKEDPEDWILKYDTVLQNFISLEEVNETIRNYLSVTNQQTFLVLPEE